MLICPATSDDVEGARGISAASGRDAWSVEMLSITPKRLVLAAEVAGELVGVAKTHFHAYPDGDAPGGHYLGGVMVKPSSRRQGVASALTSARLGWIWSRAGHAYYFANEHNIASIRLHEAFGFHALGNFSAIHGVVADDGQSDLVLFMASP
ncbi:GNAT family N-acetyltransferase [Arthrobacter agilis]|uniref:GNAT family N-acetyltransferase n=2 Tax=Arthrobacter agilis TaxID=37921 RepID=UPI000B35D82C|nr:GNAT family N-acetyltransferase [Arthrobacter agilis]OUM45677.1 hypothetical protein B8W74_00200 [Arthrobacter agilis]PPB47773.1 N-acetyltransferase [Arthrobacter agilis]TPV22456.1 GNAT family N-acetyltransferase [Arthrobacter agilis]VDR32268.1 Predicted acetyltransferase [Arthrobacter agilis]